MNSKLALVKVVVGTVIKKNGKYLLVREAMTSKASGGLWGIPAGRVEVGDRLERRAVLETQEETGYRIKILRKLFVEHTDLDHPVRHAFQGTVVSGSLRLPPDEIMDGGWFTFRQIQKMKKKIRFPWMYRAIAMVESKK